MAIVKANKPTGKILWQEVQYFRQGWLWTLMIVSAIVPLVLVIVLPLQDKRAKAGEAVMGILLVLSIESVNFLGFYFTRFETTITEEGVFYRWWPFRKKYTALPLEDIAGITVRKYPFMQYGTHKRTGYGKVHNVDGDKGVQVVLKNGQMIYLGTQRLQALEHVLRKMPPGIMNTTTSI